MSTIWKFPLQVVDRQRVSIPGGAQFLSVGNDPNGELCLWAMVEPENEPFPWYIAIVGTGNPADIDYARDEFLGTTCCPPFMWHVFRIR